jgi:uncharacterized membrane protein HdeD (DUF308 family)
MDSIVGLISYLALTSVLAERLVDMLKRTGKLDAVSFNGITYQVLSGVVGVILAFLSPPTIPFMSLDPVILPIAVGFAVSGGSSLWHGILTLVSSLSKNDLSTLEAAIKASTR